MTDVTALQFARAHDWGENARLTDDGRIAGLRDVWTQRGPDGAVTVHDEDATVPATMAAIRDFGGY